MIDPQLSGKIAIVTGANHGIGAAIATALAAQGVSVFITYFRAETPDFDADNTYRVNRLRDASAVVNAIRDAGGTCDATEIDLSRTESIPALFDVAESAFGAVDIVVNNAAYWEPATFAPERGAGSSWMDAQGVGIPLFDASAHDRVFAVNTRATALMMTEFATRHVKRVADWGRIVNISTSAAYSFPSEVVYGASKFATESYSRSAAVELGRYGITVNVVAPGPIQTGYMDAQSVEIMAHATPLGRVGMPDDVADVVTFLCSQQARWVTGQLLHVGGGQTM